MKKILRKRILTKIAQTQTNTPANQALPAMEALPGNLFTNLGSGYNAHTIEAIKQLSVLLNTGLHYSSLGKSSFNKVLNNASSSGLDDISLKIIDIIKSFNITILNNRNKFPPGKVSADTLNNQVDALLNKVNNLPQVNPSSQLAHNIRGDFKAELIKWLGAIKRANLNI